ncbi:hypothetical protein N7466_006354 [Penicillium verhagenii]|uniref:uncharacterized protein n=1 Tax=Penicillium verhagenii TaxID=1562060 RepID=UPI002544E2CC|nr:uncharacterized protein N7466_006354 [Penicillium verhagenii]KAJ5930861.1 hypothetical protein N7466_006354 [Penicillium verhagenii]
MGSFTEKARALGPDYIVIWFGGSRWKLSIFTNVLVTEYALRETLQREERLQYKVLALKKATAIELDSELQLAYAEAKSQLNETRVQRYHKQQALYREEAGINSWVRSQYDWLRTKEDWYMREEMVRECAETGGCCSRDCGCCARRAQSKPQKGRGHCTTECWCCSGQRGFELSDEDKKQAQQDYKDMLEKGQCFLELQVNCFFSPFKNQVPKPFRNQVRKPRKMKLHSRLALWLRLLFQVSFND